MPSPTARIPSSAGNWHWTSFGARLEALSEVDDPVDARIIARARAYYHT
jgi:hypothetical protein